MWAQIIFSHIPGYDDKSQSMCRRETRPMPTERVGVRGAVDCLERGILGCLGVGITKGVLYMCEMPSGGFHG